MDNYMKKEIERATKDCNYILPTSYQEELVKNGWQTYEWWKPYHSPERNKFGFFGRNPPGNYGWKVVFIENNSENPLLLWKQIGFYENFRIIRKMRGIARIFENGLKGLKKFDRVSIETDTEEIKVTLKALNTFNSYVPEIYTIFKEEQRVAHKKEQIAVHGFNPYTADIYDRDPMTSKLNSLAQSESFKAWESILRKQHYRVCIELTADKDESNILVKQLFLYKGTTICAKEELFTEKEFLKLPVKAFVKDLLKF